ncbi:hypothetical protein KAR34_02500, partial [bacterium]|nr:hypothetical protein [bacterium]
LEISRPVLDDLVQASPRNDKFREIAQKQSYDTASFAGVTSLTCFSATDIEKYYFFVLWV